MLHVGLDLCRTRVDVHVLDEVGESVVVTRAPSDADGLRGLAERLAGYGQPIHAAVESMTGARFVRDVLADCGWDFLVADAQKTKGLAPLACKTDPLTELRDVAAGHRAASLHQPATAVAGTP